MELAVVLILCALVGGGVGAAIGRSKGRVATGLVLGLFLGTFGWIILLLMKAAAPVQAQPVGVLSGASRSGEGRLVGGTAFSKSAGFALIVAGALTSLLGVLLFAFQGLLLGGVLIGAGAVLRARPP